MVQPLESRDQLDAGLGHAMPAHPDQFGIGPQRAQGLGQIRAVRVAGRFSCHDEESRHAIGAIREAIRWFGPVPDEVPQSYASAPRDALPDGDACC